MSQPYNATSSSLASMASILTGHGLDGRKCGMNVEAIDDEDVEVPVDDEAA